MSSKGSGILASGSRLLMKLSCTLLAQRGYLHFCACRSSAWELKWLLYGLIGCQILLKLFTHWLVEVKCVMQYVAVRKASQATHVKVRHSRPSCEY